jgi:hypothetical protein
MQEVPAGFCGESPGSTKFCKHWDTLPAGLRGLSFCPGAGLILGLAGRRLESTKPLAENPALPGAGGLKRLEVKFQRFLQVIEKLPLRSHLAGFARSLNRSDILYRHSSTDQEFRRFPEFRWLNPLGT